MADALDNILIVLVNPKVAGNIGWSARGMKNMGLSKLFLVNPVEFSPDELKPFAFGAEEIVRDARVFGSLGDALREAQVAVGTTRRLGRKRRGTYYLREAASKILPVARNNTVAVVFGGEQSGLSNEELSLCDMVVTIPEKTDYPSLNLSHAVTIVCYELYLASQSESLVPLLELASREELEGMFEHIRQTLASLGYDKAGERDLLESITTSLRRIFGRTGLEPADINTLRGLCRRIGKVAELLPKQTDGGNLRS